MLALLRELHAQYKCITYVGDKRYLLSLFFVDYAVEPYFERGFDLYADGQNYGMASLLHTVGPTLLGESGYDELLAAFQIAVKNKAYE
ncbi:hypothetical protein HFO73_28380 [Rhizobium laguerreae]|uniref:hypothetical protein n=1 Tax=Rhizobium laguerreae TaxID=1076926 RepID=UPI001C90F986|nr:hypothetical protein [Rhizobium laguerreae]MBY3081095.1 hypothetical protein [Rhizobium laguerreae]